LEFKQKIIILTTDTQHHRYFINKIIDEGYPIDTIFFEKNKIQPDYEKDPVFEKEENEFEKNNFFKEVPYEIEDKIKICKVDNINDSIVSDRIKELEIKIGIVFGTSLIKRKVFSLFNEKIFNIHRGIPQYYRGLDSDLWAINNNDWNRIGTTIHKVEERLDTGDYVYQQTLKLEKGMKIHHIRYHTTLIACKLVIKLLKDLFDGDVNLIKQEKLGDYYSSMPIEHKKEMKLKFNLYCDNLN
jgi:methionyl-tRNA formyltransferase